MPSQPPVNIDPTLLKYATEAQAAHIDAVIKYGSITRAAQETGVTRAAIQRAIKSSASVLAFLSTVAFVLVLIKSQKSS